ncbi:MAG: preprotein translocase subunit SecE [Phycisphaerae bacterium]|nr:preprotein translocase subunit SecE [Phycisphaerae bacterium]
MSDAVSGSGSGGKPQVKTTLGGGGLRIYRPGQGYYTRLGTALGAGVIIIAGGLFIGSQLGGIINPKASYALPVQYGVSVGFILVMAAVLYWIVGLNRKANEFFIATEGEMKKVSWSSKKDVIRSTKVVIVWVILIGALIFLADIIFMQTFRWIHVLKA